MTELPSAARSQLTPTGKLRAALNLSNFLLITEYKAGSIARGIVPDLARELARRLSVEVEFTGYDSPGKVADAAKTGTWDVAFLGAEPARASEIDFTAAYLEIEATYLVPPGSFFPPVHHSFLQDHPCLYGSLQSFYSTHLAFL